MQKSLPPENLVERLLAGEILAACAAGLMGWEGVGLQQSLRDADGEAEVVDSGVGLLIPLRKTRCL